MSARRRVHPGLAVSHKLAQSLLNMLCKGNQACHGR